MFGGSGNAKLFGFSRSDISIASVYVFEGMP